MQLRSAVELMRPAAAAAAEEGRIRVHRHRPEPRLLLRTACGATNASGRTWSEAAAAAVGGAAGSTGSLTEGEDERRCKRSGADGRIVGWTQRARMQRALDSTQGGTTTDLRLTPQVKQAYSRVRGRGRAERRLHAGASFVSPSRDWWSSGRSRVVESWQTRVEGG